PRVSRLCGTGGSSPASGGYGYLLGGLGYALLGTSRQLAIGPTSAVSPMIAATVAGMAEGDAMRYAQIASLTAFTVAMIQPDLARRGSSSVPNSPGVCVVLVMIACSSSDRKIDRSATG